MALFDNQNTFYNSTWHKQLVPQMPSMNLNIPLWLFPNYTLQWNKFRSSGFSPSVNNGYEPFPINPFSYTNLVLPSLVLPSLYNYDDIYYGVESGNTEKSIDNANLALNAFSTGMLAFNNGTYTKAGNILSTVGGAIGKIPNKYALIIGGALGTIGSSMNALFGSDVNELNVKAMDAAIDNRLKYQFGDNSTTTALVKGSENNINLISPSAKFYGTEGFLNELSGSGKTYKIKREKDRLIADANIRAKNAEIDAYKDYQNKMIRLGLLSPDFYSIAAYGGPLNTINMFKDGGGINTPRTHGGLFSSGLVEINNGGSHQANPYGGVLFGMDEYGIPNLVEEGETVFKDVGYGGPDNYSFSDRITFDIKKYGKRFNLGGLIKNKKKKKYTFADISKYLAKDANSNPNGEIILRTNASNQSDLANIQEEVKAERMLSQMNPLDIMAALLQSPMGEQMMGGMQEGMDLQAMMEQQLQLPIMAACGGKLFGLGGNIFASGSWIPNYHFNRNVRTRIGNTNTRRTTANRNRTKTKTTTTKKGSNYWQKDKNTIVSDLPEIAEWHNEMFGKAINDYIAKEYQKYQEALDEKNYDGARNIASNLQTTINNINKEYVKTVRNPSEENTTALQTVFDNAGLNININTFLNEHKGKFKKTSGALYDKDEYIDGKFGAVSKNRYIGDFNEDSIKALEAMEIARNNYYGSQQGFTPEYQLGENDLDLLKNLPLLSLGEDRTTRVVRNPNYVEGGNEPEFIPVEQDIQSRFAPKDLDAAAWWGGLTDADKLGYYNRYGNVGDPTRTGVYDWLLIVNLSEALQLALALAAKASSGTKGNTYYKLKPKKDPSFDIAAGIALNDYIDAYFGANSKPLNPGIDAAYSYLSRIGDIPMVRSHPTGTKMVYRPTDLNYEVNNVRNDTFGLLRAIDNANMNRGYNIATTMAALNQGRTAISKARQQSYEDNIKNLQNVLTNNNLVDQFNSQNSLAALTTNAQNLARAREAQAQMAAGLASQLGLNYNNWLNYRNSQSSGLAQLFADRWQANRNLEQWLRYALARNQLKDFLDIADIPYEKTIYNV